jgi:putative transposase
MRCTRRSSAAVTGRPERTAERYHRFRWRQCVKSFKEPSGTILNQAQYPFNTIIRRAALRCASCRARASRSTR